ncbi:sodium pump decarboxylase, gamma subunit [Marvinbryantia formatexigens DSM 14469]|uniref:Sodium pump decarboxylase, gamma subunit n=1 Tax=Marvinbryantia formatexigens DSM 14469 TaxID=478749 RepID=C6LMD5_9FIRM|nr:OadG family transporter subunit [Marvinbryantia formatexigens]EET58196.1 sodium pump decarboxylase, gamma subunit [Marvinbryantia formatexigens DSM 14469]UWO25475.1 OadG family transporter subunit [Marvinbryantia formatexigens DSM 14469]SDG91152.1 sodium pump decarboxylases, gamma subunit [Marvinbryantia formatexigens]
MRKFKGLVVSLSAAAMLALAAAPVYAEETETVTEAQAAEESTSTAVVNADDSISSSDSETLADYASETISLITTMSDAELDEIVNPPSLLSVPPKYSVAAVESWLEVRDELGAYVAAKEHDISADSTTITIESTCDFENGEGLVTIILDRETLTPDSITFAEQNSSLGKTMQEAALNTVMGIGIVFLVLLFLSFLISQFKHIAKLEEKMTKKNAPQAPKAAPAPAAPVAAPAPVEEEVADDGELVAVIAAAIAAAEGTTTDGFVVRSIKKSNRNKWQRA